MQFTTKTETYGGEKIAPGQKIFSIGSCFAENIAARLSLSGFSVVSNPFGVLYNPGSIAAAFDILASAEEFTASDVIQGGGLWCSPLFHGSLADPDRDRAVDKMNEAVARGRQAHAGASFVLVSFGTPWACTVSAEFEACHSVLPPGSIVANCHKFPASCFRPERMDARTIASIFRGLHAGILRDKKVIYTVSPVRYIKAGLHGNSLGKAVLHLAVEEICRENSDAFYFPAYEILTDELRDYRFYAQDMVHPSATAIEYIWERFRDEALVPQAARAAIDIGRLSAAMNHRVLSPGSASHLEHLRSMVRRTHELALKYPDADLTVQARHFDAEITKYGSR